MKREPLSARFRRGRQRRSAANCGRARPRDEQQWRADPRHTLGTCRSLRADLVHGRLVMARRVDVLDRVARHRGRRDDRGRRHRGDRRCDLDAAGEEQRLEDRDDRAKVARAETLPSTCRLGRRLVAEPGRERTTCPEEQCLDGSLREIELVADLLVRQALPFPQEERPALLFRHRIERLGEPNQLVRVDLGRGDEVLHRLEVARRLDLAPPRGRALPRQTDVLGDLVEPRRLELGIDAALEAPEGVQERRLGRVLGLLAIAQLMQAIRVDLTRVALVEIARCVRLGGGPARSDL